MQRMADPGYLNTMLLDEILNNVYMSRSAVVDGLLCSGVYILAEAPKIGKSFLVAQIAFYVSTRQKLWDYEVHQGTVLYLALEDDQHVSNVWCRWNAESALCHRCGPNYFFLWCNTSKSMLHQGSFCLCKIAFAERVATERISVFKGGWGRYPQQTDGRKCMWIATCIVCHIMLYCIHIFILVLFEQANYNISIGSGVWTIWL